MILASDFLSDVLGPTIMDFMVPGIVAGVILTYVFYKICQSWGWV
jgi:hypothetical protein